MSEDYFNNDDEQNEFEPLIKKFDHMIRSKEESFFDVDDFQTAIEYYLDNSLLDKAGAAIKIAQNQHPKSIDIQVKEAEYLYLSGRLNKSLDLLLKIEQVERTSEEVYLLIAAIYSQQREHKKSVSYFDKALALDPEEADEILLDLALEYENLKDYDKAIAKLKEALELNCENEAAAYELAYCFSMAERIEEATAFFESFINDNPYSFTGWYNLGMCYSKAMDYKQSINAFDYCILIERSISLPYHQKALLQIETEDYKGALETYQECLKYDENSAALYSFMGECHEKMGDYSKALELYRTSIKLNEYQADAWLGIGIVKDLQDDTANAIPYIKKAVQLQEENSDYWFIYAEANFKVGNIAEAETSYEKVVELEPDNLFAWLDYSNLAEEHQSLEDALLIMEDALAANTDNPKLLYRKAVYLYKNGETQEANAILGQALELDFKEHEGFLSYYPESKNIDHIVELIDLHKKKNEL